MAQQNQNEHPLWEFVRSMDNLGINPEPPRSEPPRPSEQSQRAEGGPHPPPENPFENFMSGGWFPGAHPPPPPPPGMGSHPDGPPGGRGHHHHGRRGGPHHGGMGWGGPFAGGMGGPPGWGNFERQWPFSGPPRGPGHRGRHHGRRRRSPTPSSSGSSRSRSRSHSRPRPRSASPHAEGSHADRSTRERTAPGAEDFGSRPHGPPPHPHHAHHGGRRGRRGPFPRGPPPPPFDINAFLATLTAYPLAQNIMQNFMPANARNTANADPASTNDSTSFTPPLDLFTTPNSYTIHISLPGAKKEDIGVHYSPTTSTLTISGVVYKPGNEEFLATMTSSERRDFGMFERNVVLMGNEQDGGEVDADGISAKLEDGILVVTVPRIEKEWEDIKKVEIE